MYSMEQQSENADSLFAVLLPWEDLFLSGKEFITVDKGKVWITVINLLVNPVSLCDKYYE